jgi:hypothetical protein
MEKTTKPAENRLIRAARLRKLKWIRNRLAEGYDPNWMDADPIRRMTSKTPLIQSVYARHVDAVRLLVEHGADINLECCHSTPLLLAAEIGAVGMVSLLLEMGANPDQRNAFGQCAETVASGVKGVEIKKLIAVARAKRAIGSVIAGALVRENAMEACRGHM